MLSRSSEAVEAKENRGSSNLQEQGRASPPRQPFRASQAPQYQSQQPWAPDGTTTQAKPWGQSQAQKQPWDKSQPKQQLWGQQQSQAGSRGGPQWGQGPAADANPKWGSDQPQRQTAGGPSRQGPSPAGHIPAVWAAAEPQGQEGFAPPAEQRNHEAWSDAVPVLSAESSASMVGILHILAFVR